jgi:hypothetical protein
MEFKMHKQLEKIDAKKTPLANFIALVGHTFSVILLSNAKYKENKSILWDGSIKITDPPVYKQGVRIKIKYYPDDEYPGIVCHARQTGLTNLPKRIDGLKYIVSRQSLQSIDHENRKIQTHKRLDSLISKLKALQHSCDDEMHREQIDEIIDDVYKEKEILGKPFLDEERHDFYAPGNRIKDSRSKVYGALGLIGSFS